MKKTLPFETFDILKDSFELLNIIDTKMLSLNDINNDLGMMELFKEQLSYYLKKYNLIDDAEFDNNIIDLSYDIFKFRSLVNSWIEYSHKKYCLEEFYVLNDFTSLSWKDILETSLDLSNINPCVKYSNNQPIITWQYKTLYDALKIVFIQNIVMKNKNIDICHYNKCHKIFIHRNDNQVCCSNSCNNAYRQQRYRDKNKVVKMIKKGISPSSIAQTMNVGIAYVNELQE